MFENNLKDLLNTSVPGMKMFLSFLQTEVAISSVKHQRELFQFPLHKHATECFS